MDNKKVAIIGVAIVLIVFMFIMYKTIDNAKITGSAISSTAAFCNLEIESPASQNKFLKAKQNIEANKLEPIIQEYSGKYDIDPDLVRAVITIESLGIPDAVSGSDTGLMQVNKIHVDEKTCKICHVTSTDDLKDPEKNICCGAKILSDFDNMYGSKDNSKIIDKYCENPEYNAKYKKYSGPKAILRAYNGWACPATAVNYVEEVIEYYEAWSGKCLVEEKAIAIPKKIGKYLIRPSFKTEIDFDLKVYETIKESAKEIINNIEVCEQTETDSGESVSFENCLKVELAKLNEDKETNLKWSISCEKEEQKIFDDFVEYFISCKDSGDNDCYCQHYLTSRQSFSINHVGDDALISFEMNNKKFQETIKNVNLMEEKFSFSTGSNYLKKDVDGKMTYGGHWPGDQCTLAEKRTYKFCVDTNKQINDENVIIKFALSFGAISIEPEERNLIFIPVNWETDESDFKQKAEVSFDYFIQLANAEGDQTVYDPIYQFSNIEIPDLKNLRAAVEKLENHVISLNLLYNKNKDVIIAFTEDSFEEVKGFVYFPYNQVAFVNSNPSILSHELGHALYGYCEEYEYFNIECPDSIEHKDLVEDGIYDNIELVTNLFYDMTIKDLSYEEMIDGISEMENMDEYANKYPDTEEGIDNMAENLLDAIVGCDMEGWLPQHYLNKYHFKNFKEEYPRMFDGCQNSYPICCADSPYYISDTSTGINCYPDDYDTTIAEQETITEIQEDSSLTEEEKQEEINEINSMPKEELLQYELLCAGSSCGSNCRCIMGPTNLEYPITSRKYP